MADIRYGKFSIHVFLVGESVHKRAQCIFHCGDQPDDSPNILRAISGTDFCRQFEPVRRVERTFVILLARISRPRRFKRIARRTIILR